MTETQLRDRSALWQRLEDLKLDAWGASLRATEPTWFAPSSHGTLPKWLDAYDHLPTFGDAEIRIGESLVEIESQSGRVDQVALKNALMAFHPWRKGPFRFFGIDIDTEWRSNLKWDRLASHVDFSGKSILDVGCGNGYYGWRMLDAGAKFVLGCEPFLLYAMQFEAARKYAAESQKHFAVPLGDTDLPSKLAAFDLSLSMGVLYHRPNPIDHLQRMGSTLTPDGQLILETIVLDKYGNHVLTPESRYAKMRNVWFLPTVELLSIWLRRSGFRDVELLDVAKTTVEEQRSTAWMTFESLADFLDPSDHTKTIEGHPAPVRAILSARPK